MGLAATRAVPLKMLPFDNKNELLLDPRLRRGNDTRTIQRRGPGDRIRSRSRCLKSPISPATSALSSPIDFNGLVRHYYLRQMPHQAEIRINLVGKKQRKAQSHALALRLHDPLTRIAEKHKARLKIVELPPGPPVLSSIVAEVYGRPTNPTLSSSPRRARSPTALRKETRRDRGR